MENWKKEIRQVATSEVMLQGRQRDQSSGGHQKTFRGVQAGPAEWNTTDDYRGVYREEDTQLTGEIGSPDGEQGLQHRDHPGQSMNEIKVCQVLEKMMENLDQQRQMNLQRSRPSWTDKDAVKVRRMMKTHLTIDGLKGEDLKGIQHLNDWITEVEEYCTEDSMRV